MSENITCLMGSLWPKYMIFELKIYRGVIFDGTEDWCKKKKKKNWFVLSNMTGNLANFHWLKSSDSVLEIKIGELSKDKNWEQVDWLDPLRKFYFTLKLNE